jgi:N-methylhydantoinase A/oxoprolinase/acetone carboxylase beta subunit
MQYFCGVDTGGTFTDCVVMDEQGQITIAKSPSTPSDFALGFFNALEVAAEKLELTLDQHVEAIAIAFLWGFINPSHELAVKQLVQEMSPETFVTCAHELIA